MDGDAGSPLVQFESQLARCLTRIARLEADAEKDDLRIVQSQVKQEAFKKSYDDELNTISVLLGDVGVELELLRRQASGMVFGFRDLVKREQLSLLSSRIDSWPLESFMTRNEFERLLTERF